MKRIKRQVSIAVRIEGGLLSSDFLLRLNDGKEIEGYSPESYHLEAGNRINESINKSWNRLIGAWRSFRQALDKLPENDLGTTVTREKWLLPLFQELGYGRLQSSKAVEVQGKTYAISHIWQNVPIHLVGYKVEIDKRSPGVSGASRSSPHSMMQEFLNKEDKYLWAFISNGRTLRILRDNFSLTRQSFIEFDLEEIMEGELYSDFSMLWVLCHQSRVEAEKPEEFWLEKWTKEALEKGTRALDQLRSGVEEALKILGGGFLKHPANKNLLDRLKNGELSVQDYYRELLRTIYRILFLFVAEEREVLLFPDAKPETKEFYYLYYSLTRIREISQKLKGTDHDDLWEQFSLLVTKLGKGGSAEIGLPELGSMLFSTESTKDLTGCRITNREFLDAIRALTTLTEGSVRQPVDYKNIRSEELGSIYEALLELQPELNRNTGSFNLKTMAGNERKTSGSYYTPDSLVQCLLDSALNPVLEDAAKKDNPEKSILALKVCDPACGSGHFLIGAAHRIARKLAGVRSGEEEPSPDENRKAIRDVISHCLYGIDLNPMAVELCKVALWMEAVEPGKPLSFLDHHIQVGNSLLGVTPALLDKGIPDEAFEPIEGDEKEYCKTYRKRNKEEREGVQFLFNNGGTPWNKTGNLAATLAQINDIVEDTPEGAKKKQDEYEKWVKSQGYLNNRFLADTWCASFVIKKSQETPYAITEDIFRKIEKNPFDVDTWLKDEIVQLAKEYRFFHWHIAFPDVFRLPMGQERPENELNSWMGGFDCVLGNPPWERVKLQEKEWFAERSPEIANAPNASARKKLIEKLLKDDPELLKLFQNDLRRAEGESYLLRNSNRYPLCGRGDVNTYTVFAELNKSLINVLGRMGCIVPSGIATDDTTKYFFQNLFDNQSLVSLFDFENSEGIFNSVHRGYKFCLMTLSGIKNPVLNGADFIFFATNTSQLSDCNRRFTLTKDDIYLLNPNTRTCPVFRSSADAVLAMAIYRRDPVLIKEEPEEINPWHISFKSMFHMANDSGLFRTKLQLEADGGKLKGNIINKNGEVYLPLYEPKLIHQYNHRWSTFSGVSLEDLKNGNTNDISINELDDPYIFSLPRYWVIENDVAEACIEIPLTWFIGVRGVTGTTNERTFVSTIIPRYAAQHNLWLLSVNNTLAAVSLLSMFNSYVFDYFTRLKMSSYMSQFVVKQLPNLHKTIFNLKSLWGDTKLVDWLFPYVIELTYTAWDLISFAQDSGYNGSPFKWDEERRFLLRCELDAAFFHMYLLALPDGQWKQARISEGAVRDETTDELAELIKHFPTPRHAVEYIMETFPIVKRKDEEKYKEYRTKRVILEIYDAMAEAIHTGKAYQTRLDPPPADPRCAHPPRKGAGK